MTDRNGVSVTVGGYVRAVPDSEDVEEIIRVSAVTSGGQRMDVEVLDEDDPSVQAKLAGPEPTFSSGGGTFGGGGASGGW